MRTSWLWWALFGTSLVQTTPIEAAADHVQQNAGCEGPSLTAFAVGEAGTILRSDDGFVTWISQQSGTANTLFGVSFLDAETGMVVGAAGTILRTDDGGQTWAAQDGGSTHDLRAVSFVDPLTAVAVGTAGTVLRTDDGGETWFALQSGTTYALTAVTFFDADRGITNGGLSPYPFIIRGITLLTADGGATWDEVPTAWFPGLSFANPETGVGVGYRGREELRSFISRTTDGGRSWREVSGEQSPPLYAVSLVDTDTGTAVGRSGTIVRTTDGGATWTQQASGTGSVLLGVSFLDRDRGIAVGLFYVSLRKAVATILRTDDGGETWGTAQRAGFSFGLEAVSFVDANRPSRAACRR